MLVHKLSFITENLEMGEQSGEYLNLQGFEHQSVGDTSEASARLQASQWTTFGISLHKLMSVMGGQKKEFPPWVEEATTALAKGGPDLFLARTSLNSPRS